MGDIVGGLLGTNDQADAAQQAASTQAGAAKYAADLQNKAFQQLQQKLAPYTSIGTGVVPALLNQLGYRGNYSGGNLTGLTPSSTGLGSVGQFSFNPTQDQLEQTPGYQFTLQQGLKGVNNAMAAKGLGGLSGAQQRGIADYTTGLASNTYQQQYQNALNNYMTNYNVQQGRASNLMNLLNLGQSSAAGVGNAGMQNAAAMGNYATQGANAQAAGMINAGNQQSNTISSLMGLGSSAAGIFSLLSDARFKTDIEHIGYTQSGHKVYEYRYKGDKKIHHGVMAQEVEKTNPEAVVEVDGVKYVDYSKVN